MENIHNIDNGTLNAFEDDETIDNIQTGNQSSPRNSPKSYRTPVHDRTRIPKKIPQKPRKNKDARPDFRLTTSDIVRVLTYD